MHVTSNTQAGDPLGNLAAFLAIVAAAVILAFASIVIRRCLPHGNRKSTVAQNGVAADIFRSLKYHASGPIAEFVIVFSTVAFIASVFWILLGWHKGP